MGLSRVIVWQALVFGCLATAIPLKLAAQNDAIDEKESAGPVEDTSPTLAEQRLMFQNQEQMIAKTGGWVFAPGNAASRWSLFPRKRRRPCGPTPGRGIFGNCAMWWSGR